jgi:hypothetical protein
MSSAACSMPHDAAAAGDEAAAAEEEEQAAASPSSAAEVDNGIQDARLPERELARQCRAPGVPTPPASMAASPLPPKRASS